MPLSEETETYLLRVLQGAVVLREQTVGEPAWTYTAEAQAADGIAQPFDIEVAQVSAQVGAGAFERITVGA